MGSQTAKRLRENSEKILDRWEKRAKAEIKAATNQDTLLLRNELPEQLLHIANALTTTIARTDIRVRWDLNEAHRLGKLHGQTRAGQASYTIDQLIFEYHILRQVICDVMEEKIALSDIEREIITCTIEQSVNDAATEFSTAHSKIQQELIHTLAHDLRGPVTAAKIIAQQLQRKLINEEEIAKRITKNMDRLDLMIQDLLDVGRLKAGERLSLEFKECDLDTIVIQTIKDLNFIYNNRFKYISSGDCVGLWSAKGLKRLIENLAINAIKYGSADTDITITLDNSSDEIILSVHNEGSSIPLEDQEALFDRFRRPYYTEEKTGWGLGLTIVQAMARAHNGSVEVESLEGEGTTFSVKFPKSPAFNNIQHTQYSTQSSLLM
ncbi:MAG: HAMP domain-containing sensor histidine kinase [Bacteriovorax sp.]|nr:HAMP domain-containing sensor histidine kinase [Bacteriovorax sp.]